MLQEHRKASHFRTLKQLAAYGSGTQADDEALSFDDSYLIEGSDGSFSQGYIQSYDRSRGLYHVLVVGVGYKHVPREQIALDTVHF